MYVMKVVHISNHYPVFVMKVVHISNHYPVFVMKVVHISNHYPVYVMKVVHTSNHYPVYVMKVVHTSNHYPVFVFTGERVTVSVSPANLRILDGREAVFQCRVTGHPRPETRWSRQGQVSVRNHR